MAFDGSELLPLARNLLQAAPSGGGGEAALRTVISRAYYAAYLVARTYFEDNGHRVPYGARGPSWICEQLMLSRDPELASLGIALDWLRRSRNKADYGDTIKGLRQVASLACQQAEQIISTLRQPKSP